MLFLPGLKKFFCEFCSNPLGKVSRDDKDRTLTLRSQKDAMTIVPTNKEINFLNKKDLDVENIWINYLKNYS